jgi:thiol-disulfide isomerase/thioredoxin
LSELILKDRWEELQLVLDNNKSVLVEFGADWCVPCQRFLPHFKKYAEMQNEIVCVKVDVEIDSDIMLMYGIQSIPQVMLFENGEYVRHVEARTVVALKNELSE